LGQRYWLRERLAGFDFDLRIFGIGSVDRDDRCGADGALFFAGVIDDQAVSGLHFG
jgi:hypothetical protein